MRFSSADKVLKFTQDYIGFKEIFKCFFSLLYIIPQNLETDLIIYRIQFLGSVNVF